MFELQLQSVLKLIKSFTLALATRMAMQSKMKRITEKISDHRRQSRLKKVGTGGPPDVKEEIRTFSFKVGTSFGRLI